MSENQRTRGSDVKGVAFADDLLSKKEKLEERQTVSSGPNSAQRRAEP